MTPNTNESATCSPETGWLVQLLPSKWRISCGLRAGKLARLLWYHPDVPDRYFLEQLEHNDLTVAFGTNLTVLTVLEARALVAAGGWVTPNGEDCDAQSL